MSRILLFARRPQLGKVKTRLCPPLTPEQALSLYRAFLSDHLDLLRTCAAHGRPEVWWDAPLEAAEYGLDTSGLTEHVQPSGDLGERLAHAFGAEETPAVAIGADSPTLGSRAIENALETLSASRPLALMPALDGGYVLLGLWRMRSEIFRDVPWGTEDVADVTLANAERAGVPVTLLPAGYDVDDADGLRRLEHDLAYPEIAARAPATARSLRLLF